jgi:polar amino acid transport system ATP-binding protein
MIEVRGVHKSFGDLHVLRGVNLVVKKGDVLVIIGPSGSGKSTLLRCINLLVQPDQGVILIDGVKVNDPKIRPEWVRQQVGMLFQSFNLFTHLTALENVEMGLRKVKRMPRAEAERLARFELERVGLADKADAYPAQLSGGQQQRVAIARALANRPRLILADEPTGNLDTKTGRVIVSLLHGLARSEQTTILAVTHDLAVAVKTDMTYEMEDGKLVPGQGVDDLAGAVPG